MCVSFCSGNGLLISDYPTRTRRVYETNVSYTFSSYSNTIIFYTCIYIYKYDTCSDWKGQVLFQAAGFEDKTRSRYVFFRFSLRAPFADRLPVSNLKYLMYL